MCQIFNIKAGYETLVSTPKLLTTRNKCLRVISGFICLSLPPPRLAALSLPPLLASSGHSQDPKGTAYHLTVDANVAKHPITTGISAHDRAYTARLLAEGAGEDDFTRPGHLMTLRYTPGGVRKRRGHTECAVGELLFGMLADDYCLGWISWTHFNGDEV